MIPIEHIAVGVAEDGVSIFTVKYAIYLAGLLQARLTVLHVINEKLLHDLLRSRIFVEEESRSYAREIEEHVTKFLARAKKMAESKEVICDTLLLRGEVHEEVVKTVRAIEADILVVGGLKETVSRRDLFYDEGERILQESPCPVVVVKNIEEVEALYRSM